MACCPVSRQAQAATSSALGLSIAFIELTAESCPQKRQHCGRHWGCSCDHQPDFPTQARLYLVKDELIPQAVVPDDATAKLRLFPFGGKVQQPSLQGSVCLSKNLMRQEVRFSHLPRQPKPRGKTTCADTAPRSLVAAGGVDTALESCRPDPLAIKYKSAPWPNSTNENMATETCVQASTSRAIYKAKS